mmetsp:Transcript_1545/g.3721  ORF Transcript_1545/g.3721 Transcript_1545/m.3721 type:complete len:443 (+) Transcript_1545:572-1900(+)
MDAHCILQVLLRETGLERYAETLDHLACIRAQDVGAEDFLALRLVTNHLHVADVAVRRPHAVEVRAPFEDGSERMVDLDVLLPAFLLCLLLAHADRTVLDGGEDCGGDVGVVHELCGATEEAAHQTAAGLDGDRGQLRHAINHVADGVDVRHAGLVGFVHLELAIGLDVVQSGSLDIECPCEAFPAHGHEDSVEHPPLLVLHEDADLARLGLLEFAWDHLAGKLDAVLLHVVADLAGNVLVEAPQQNGAHHDSGVKAKASNKASALESNVGGSDDQCLARGLLPPEDVVRADAAFLRAGIATIIRAATASDNAKLEGDLLDTTLAVVETHCVRVCEGGKFVVVLDVALSEVRLGTEVEGLDVVVHVRNHLGPCVRRLRLPAQILSVRLCLPVQRRDVHQLFRDTPHVDARAAEAPCGAGWGRLHKVGDSDLGAKVGGDFGGC